mmetsp:Transcript_11432/g.13887  ORF Transcript_11432/g.13887 Transcript_11432/m.13887 type:complete len:101 (-) Transcript_11432:113-415(-)
MNERTKTGLRPQEPRSAATGTAQMIFAKPSAAQTAPHSSADRKKFCATSSGMIDSIAVAGRKKSVWEIVATTCGWVRTGLAAIWVVDTCSLRPLGRFIHR